MHFSIRRIIPITTLAGGLLLYTGAVRADSEAGPRDFQVKSANGSYVLVVLPAYKFTRRDPALRARYKTSGVYKRENPVKPLYSVSPQTRTGFLSGDGKYLVEMGPWARQVSDRAFAFYANGKMLREYRIEQLVADQLSLPRSVSHFMWLKDARLNDATRDFSVATLDNRRYVFALSTGLLKSGQLVGKMQQPEAITRFLAGDLPGLRALGEQGQQQLRDAIMARRDTAAAQIVPGLAAFGANAIPTLKTLAEHRDAIVRQMVVEVTNEIGTPAAAPLLRSKFTDTDATVRAKAISGLYALGFQSEAVPAALHELKTATPAERDKVLYGLNGVYAPELIPVLIEDLNSDTPPMNRAYWWLRATTFQEIGGPSAAAQKAWRTWWEKNKNGSPEDWYRLAIGRAIEDLRTPDWQSAQSRLENLTGRGISANTQSAIYKAWTTWWKTNQSRRPSQIAIESLAASKEYFPEESQKIIERFATAEDVPALVTAYEKADLLGKVAIEDILRRITGVDSSGSVFIPEEDKKAIEAWKQWIKDHPAEQSTPDSTKG